MPVEGTTDDESRPVSPRRPLARTRPRGRGWGGIPSSSFSRERPSTALLRDSPPRRACP